MIKKKNNIRLLLTNRLSIVLIIVLLIILFAIGINRYRIVHSRIYTNLQGTYEIELDSSYVYRYFDVIPFGFVVQIHKDNICLPIFKSENSTTNARVTYQEIVKIEEERNGTWEMISFDPDSIFIEAEGHLLNGKYQVVFKTYKTGRLGYTTVNYMYLDNDSTHLCLKRIEQSAAP